MMARFVAMHIAAQQAFLRHILGLGEKLSRQVHRKQGIELGDKGFVASHQADHPLDIVRHEPSLGIPHIRIKNIRIIGRPFFIRIGNRTVAGQKRRVVNGPVVISIFQRQGSGAAVMVKCDIPLFHVFAGPVQVRDRGTAHHRFQNLFLV